jgi:hypothetical protein
MDHFLSDNASSPARPSLDMLQEHEFQLPTSVTPFPREIWDRIFLHYDISKKTNPDGFKIDRKTLLSIAITSQYINQSAMLALYRHVEWPKDNVVERGLLLRSLISSNAAHWAHTFQEYSLNFDIAGDSSLDITAWRLEEVSALDARAAEITYLTEQDLVWNKTKEEVLRGIAIHLLPNLKTLGAGFTVMSPHFFKLHFQPWSIRPLNSAFNQLSHLQTLKLRFSSGESPMQSATARILDVLSDLPMLDSLELSGYVPRIYEEHWRTSRIQSLSLNQVDIDLDTLETLLSLGNLTHLTFSTASTAPSNPFNFSDFSHVVSFLQPNLESLTFSVRCHEQIEYSDIFVNMWYLKRLTKLTISYLPLILAYEPKRSSIDWWNLPHSLKEIIISDSYPWRGTKLTGILSELARTKGDAFPFLQEVSVQVDHKEIPPRRLHRKLLRRFEKKDIVLKLLLVKDEDLSSSRGF